MIRSLAKRRGTSLQPPNRFEKIALVHEDQEIGIESSVSLPVLQTEVYRDASRSVVTENDSPDISFRYSLNPYRGCEHGCTYCYARPSHEYLGMSAGLDFERKIMAKIDAPKLLTKFLRDPKYQCEPIVLSGVTDPYQPIERKLQITRSCLELMLGCGQPVEIITKSRLILRDIDILSSLARRGLVRVAIAITTLDEKLQHEMEPRASSPLGRLEMMKQLSSAGVPVHLLIAPLIPGLTDAEVPRILQTAGRCGARSASFVLLRLPHAVKDIFFDWLLRVYPEKRAKIEARIREVRGGQLNVSRFHERMKGTGKYAEEIGKMFRIFRARAGLDRTIAPLDCSQFQVPADSTGQLTLF